jgi:hypothetical protein
VNRVVATTSGEAEAEMICARLSDAGIPALYKRNIGADLPQFGGRGARDVYVEEHDLARARELLAAQDFTDEELAELSEQSFEDITGHKPPEA